LQKFVCSKDRLPSLLECEDFLGWNKSAPRISKIPHVVQASNLIRHQEIYLKGGFWALCFYSISKKKKSYIFFSHLCTYLFYLASEAKFLGLNPNSHSLNQLFQADLSEGICNIKCILYLHWVSNFFPSHACDFLSHISALFLWHANSFVCLSIGVLGSNPGLKKGS